MRPWKIARAAERAARRSRRPGRFGLLRPRALFGGLACSRADSRISRYRIDDTLPRISTND